MDGNLEEKEESCSKMHIVSYDEKPGIQVIATITPDLIEGFFGKMTRQMLSEIRVESKNKLISSIYKYFDEVNEVPVVYHRKYTLDEIGKNKKVKIDIAV